MASQASLVSAILVSAALLAPAEQAPQTPASARLILVVVAGEGAINNVKQRAARDTIVQVEDENHRPVAGAAVIFLLPNDGPGGEFAGGATTAALVTDSNGQAVMPRLTANQQAGRFAIRVNATYQGRQGNTTITQSNATEGGGTGNMRVRRGGISGKALGILVGIAAAGAVGAAVALKGGSAPQNAASIPAGSVTGPTGASLGPPH